MATLIDWLFRIVQTEGPFIGWRLPDKSRVARVFRESAVAFRTRLNELARSLLKTEDPLPTATF